MTNMTVCDGLVLKTDIKGRVKTPPERRESLLNEFERSGLSGVEFAKLAGIKYQTFAAWAARRRKQRGSTAPPLKAVDPVRWLEAVVNEAQPAVASPPTPLKLRLPTGAWIELSEPNQVGLAVALVHALERPLPPC